MELISATFQQHWQADSNGKLNMHAADDHTPDRANQPDSIAYILLENN